MPAEAKVIYIPFQNGMPAGDALLVLSGFLEGTGALLAADDVGQSIWRVAAAQ